ncbi:release factor H-coupled R [Plenodomus tracheiphilus IPT5]|uniref:3'-phosphate/5'-hydroxy nucleic acid ligase n=1 Tax=Plenodomus tracheiphilus IPT5 TaxID=1408161 RepID=A0A6A7BLL1_9PLEO|nr:release factor H-coupled R [Plenodomus tracheiphilus IPT5]
MPSICVTVASNTNQSQKAPLLVPASATAGPEDTTSIRALVFKVARSKLRLKRPARVFVGGIGRELVSEQDWKANINNNIVLLVSSGEDYVGAETESSIHVDLHPDCPIEVLASNAQTDSLSIAQLTTTAHTLPGIVHAVGQPDLHPGTKFPIGAVFASKRWIHPPLIGGDIGCGMAWYKTTLSRSQLDSDKGKRVADRLRGLEGQWKTQAHRELWLQNDQDSFAAGKQWDVSLGTIGAGNHFAELQVVEKSSLIDTEHVTLRQDDVILLVHSGSRGLGGTVLQKYTAGFQVSLEDTSPEAIAYLNEHNKACQWAQANRDLIALRFLSCLEPGNEDWYLGTSDATSDTDADVTAIEQTKKKLQQRKVVDIWHNNVERVKWPPSPPSSVAKETCSTPELPEPTSNLALDENIPQKEQEYVYMHRKGAAPTYVPESHQPLSILPLPGSRGTPTLILEPTFSEATGWGLKNALSLAHGAGRAMSRAKALSSLSQKYKGQNLLEPRCSDAEGTWVICDEKDLVFEEAPDAYKDVEAVGRDLVDAGVANVVGWCSARVSYKVRNEVR